MVVESDIRARQNPTRIKRAEVNLLEPAAAVEQLKAQLSGPSAGRVLFCSSTYDLARLGPELHRAFDDAPLAGCTTAGEVGSRGYLPTPGISGFSLPADAFDMDVGFIHDLRSVDTRRLGETASSIIAHHRDTERSGYSFGMLLIDGLSIREEAVVRTVHSSLREIPLVGGSAGDDLRFRQTHVLIDGQFVSDAASLTLVRTRWPFHVFKHQHIRGDSKKLVVTAAIPRQRIVLEFNGYEAAQAYADAIGLEVGELNSDVFSIHPVIFRVGNAEYVRSIQGTVPGGGLRFFCAIDEGIVLTMAQGDDMLGHLSHCADELESIVGPAALTIGFDCILRRNESLVRDHVEGIDNIFRRLNLCGFATYGEQIGPMHVNQTLTGVTIGYPNAA